MRHPGGAPTRLHVDDLDAAWPQQGAGEMTIGLPAGRGLPGYGTLPRAAATVVLGCCSHRAARRRERTVRRILETVSSVGLERARLMATMVEVGLADIGPDDEPRRLSAPTEFSADEIRAALVLTRRAADAQFWTAHDLLTRLPAVHAAMAAGVCDEPRARIFSEWTTDLCPEQARAVCERLLPRVGQLTTGQLIDQIKKLAITLDRTGPGGATNRPSPTAR